MVDYYEIDCDERRGKISYFDLRQSSLHMPTVEYRWSGVATRNALVGACGDGAGSLGEGFPALYGLATFSLFGENFEKHVVLTLVAVYEEAELFLRGTDGVDRRCHEQHIIFTAVFAE